MLGALDVGCQEHFPDFVGDSGALASLAVSSS